MTRGIRNAWPVLLLLLLAAPAHAQRGASFHRVTTLRREAPSAPARPGGIDARAAVQGREPFDPLRPYTSIPSTVPGTPGAYAPPIPRAGRTAPARAIQHTYYPTMRTGQGPNRNVGGGRCTRSRASIVAPPRMMPGAGSLLPPPSLGMPRR